MTKSKSRKKNRRSASWRFRTSPEVLWDIVRAGRLFARNLLVRFPMEFRTSAAEARPSSDGFVRAAAPIQCEAPT